MAGIIQQSHCAFTKSCVNTNSPHVRIQGTNKIMCCTHAAVLGTVASTGGGTEFSASSFRPPRSSRGRRSHWATYVGIMTGGQQ